MEEKKKDNKELEMMEIAPEALDKIAGGMSERDQAKLMDLLAQNAIKDAAKKYGDSLTLQKAMDHGYEYLPRFVRPSSKFPPSCSGSRTFGPRWVTTKSSAPNNFFRAQEAGRIIPG